MGEGHSTLFGEQAVFVREFTKFSGEWNTLPGGGQLKK